MGEREQEYDMAAYLHRGENQEVTGMKKLRTIVYEHFSQWPFNMVASTSLAMYVCICGYTMSLPKECAED